MYLLKNISKTRSIACDLKDGSSLRLLPESEVTIKDNNMTDYLKKLSEKDRPFILISRVEESVKKVEKPKKDEKDLKEVKNG